MIKKGSVLLSLDLKHSFCIAVRVSPLDKLKLKIGFLIWVGGSTLLVAGLLV